MRQQRASILNEKTIERQYLERPFLGFGLGLRPEHYELILSEKPPIDWFEIITENYLVAGGKALDYLDRIGAQYPLVMHGVSLSIGSSDPLNQDYLRAVAALIERVKPRWISDHLCWTGIHHKNTHDLLPLPYTPEAVKHVVSRIKQVQDILGQRILLENVSSYVTYHASSLTEWDFLAEICIEADCLILLDVNNVYVSAMNHGYNPWDYIAALPGERVYQLHLAGHSNMGDYLIDTHDHPIVDPVWDLYQKTQHHLGPVSAMIERDDHFPPFSDLLLELNQARRLAENTTLVRESHAHID